MPRPQFTTYRLQSADGVELAYRCYPPTSSEARPDVLLVHGLASASGQFHREALRFAAAGHRVLVPDLRGHGASGVPAGKLTPEQFRIATLAQDVLAVLDHAGAAPVHWVGNSLGGIIALQLLGTSARARLRSLATFGTCYRMNLPWVVPMLFRSAFLPGRVTTAWLTARSTTADPWGRAAVATAIRQLNVAAGVAIAHNVRCYDFLANVPASGVPILLLRGGRDTVVNAGLAGHFDQLVASPNFRHIELSAGGHCANLDMHDAFCRALTSFWDGIAP